MNPKTEESKFDGIKHLPICENHHCPGCIIEESIMTKIPISQNKTEEILKEKI